MRFKEGTIVKPLPTDDLISHKEQYWRVRLPNVYKEFVGKYGGGIPEKCSFNYIKGSLRPASFDINYIIDGNSCSITLIN